MIIIFILQYLVGIIINFSMMKYNKIIKEDIKQNDDDYYGMIVFSLLPLFQCGVFILLLAVIIKEKIIKQ